MKILSGWVPAHVGLMVNEELDRNAEQALQGVAGGQRSGEYTGREQQGIVVNSQHFFN